MGKLDWPAASLKPFYVLRKPLRSTPGLASQCAHGRLLRNVTASRTRNRGHEGQKPTAPAPNALKMGSLFTNCVFAMVMSLLADTLAQAFESGGHADWQWDHARFIWAAV